MRKSLPRSIPLEQRVVLCDAVSERAAVGSMRERTGATLVQRHTGRPSPPKGPVD